MIIILKNADFSKSNIGTLSTWRISHSLGAGATYEGVTSVDKGAAFTATVTIADGYEIGTAGITVTMGGTVLSDAHSISGNVITLTIASVTGNVLIKVPTVNTATGEEEPTLPDSPDHPTGLVSGDITSQFSFTNSASINYTNGTDKTAANGTAVDTNWVCSDYVDISGYAGINIMMPISSNQSSLVGCAFYDENKTYISGEKVGYGTALGVESRTIEIPANAKYIRTTWPTDKLNGFDQSWTFSCYAYIYSSNITSQFSFTGNYGSINYTNGTDKTGSSGTTLDDNWLHNDYVDVSEYAFINIAMPISTSSTSLVGCAFYDENKTYISGEKVGYGTALGVESRTIEIPANAKYIRTTWGSEKFTGFSSSWVFTCVAYN